MSINSTLLKTGVRGCPAGEGTAALGISSTLLSFAGIILADQGSVWMSDLARKSTSSPSSSFQLQSTSTPLDTSSKLAPDTAPVKGGLDEDPSFNNDLLIKRIDFIGSQIAEGMKILQISHKRSSVIYDMNTATLSPSVKKTKEGFEITIPLLYLLELDDLDPSSPGHCLLKNLNPESVKYLSLFKIFWKNKRLANQARRFILFHELAHVARGHIDIPPHNMQESRKREREADLLAAAISDAADGGAYLFNLFAKFSPSNPNTHPPDAERASYLARVFRLP